MRINISVRQRLIFGFSLLTVFILCITAVGISRLAATGRAMSSLTQDRVEKMLIVDELLTNNMENGRNARDLLLATKVEERNRIKDSIKKIRGSNGELSKRLEELSVSPEEKELLAKIAAARKAAGGKFDKFVAAAEVNAEQARNEIMPDYVSANEGAKKAIVDYRQFQLDQMRITVDNAHREYQNSRTLMIALLVVAVVAGMLVAAWISRSVAGPLARLRAAMAEVGANNDFTRQIEITSHDEVGQTAAAFNTLLATLRDSLSDLRACIVDVNGSVGSLATSSQQAANASNQSSESASAMAAAVEEMSVSISSVSDSTRDALTMAKAAENHSSEGGEIIGDAVNEVRRIVTMVNDVSQNISELSQNSDRISGIVQVISEVAEQTNLLALNAAIEAARAGETGRGFAVVADEVRKLAERTTKATSEISEMIRAIQASSDSAASSIGTAVEQVEKGADLAEKAGSAITSIRDSNNHVLDAVNRINDAMREQNSASQEIARRVENVARSSEESATSVQLSADTTQRIFTLAQQMRGTVERFRV